jgi:hypothetical protein
MSNDENTATPESQPATPPPVEQEILLGEQRSNYQNFIVGIEVAPPDPGGLPAPEAAAAPPPTMDAAPPAEASPQSADTPSE